MCNAFHTFKQNLFSHLPSGMTSCTEEDDDDNLSNAEAATTRPPRKKPKKTDKANESQPAQPDKVETTQGEPLNDDGDAEGKGRLDLAKMLEAARKAVGKPSESTDP